MHKRVITNKATTALQQTGVSGGQFSSTTLLLKEVETAGMLRLHSLNSPESLALAISETGIDLPLKTGHAKGNDPAAMCLRPREWLFFSEHQGPARLLQKLQKSINPRHTTLYDTSDGLAVFRLSGTGAPWLLSKLSCLDFLAGCSGGQHCARTRMAHASVLVHYHEPADDGFCFDLIFDRSIAKYMWTLLLDSAPHADELMADFGRTP